MKSDAVKFFNWVHDNYTKGANGWIQWPANHFSTGKTIEELYKIFNIQTLSRHRMKPIDIYNIPEWAKKPEDGVYVTYNRERGEWEFDGDKEKYDVTFKDGKAIIEDKQK